MKTAVTPASRKARVGLALLLAAALAAAGERADAQQQKQYSIISVGTVRGVSKVLTLEGIQRKTWAKYALWSNNNRDIYFKSGEKFYGHVHSNSKLWFSGDPEFFDRCTTAVTNYGGSTNDCVFHKGFDLGVASNSMAEVSFPGLLDKASLVVTGLTTVLFSGTNLVISNSRRGWTAHTNSVYDVPVIYVANSKSGSDKYDVCVSGQLDGRVTIVSERDVLITNHVTYACDPKTNAASDDALGLISMRDIVVKPSCPNDLKLYAHMMATGQYDTNSVTDGSFGVENYSSGAPRGKLTVHGGIVQDYRGAVGTFNPSTGQMVSGYEKDYTYDTRFAVDPPPEYPPLSNELVFETWKDN